jgi:hypothetical protein
MKVNKATGESCADNCFLLINAERKADDAAFDMWCVMAKYCGVSHGETRCFARMKLNTPDHDLCDYKECPILKEVKK